MPFGIGFNPSYFRRDVINPTPPAPQGFAPDFLSALESNFGRTPAMETYLDYIKQAPQRGDYNQGTLAKILTAVAGAGTALREGPSAGLSVVRNIQETPFQRAMQEFNSKGQYLRDIANIEQRNMGDKVNYLKGLLTYQTAKEKERGEQSRFDVTSKQKDRDLDLEEQLNKIKAQEAKDKADYNAGRLSVDMYRAKVAASNAQSAAISNQIAAARLGLDREKWEKGRQPTPYEETRIATDIFSKDVKTNPLFADYLDENGNLEWDSLPDDIRLIAQNMLRKAEQTARTRW